MKPHIAISIFGVSLLVMNLSCRRTSDTIKSDDERLAVTYVDLLILQAQFGASDSTGRPADLERQRIEILTRARLTRAQFDSQFAAIAQSAERAHTFFDTVDRLVAERKNTSR